MIPEHLTASVLHSSVHTAVVCRNRDHVTTLAQPHNDYIQSHTLSFSTWFSDSRLSHCCYPENWDTIISSMYVCTSNQQCHMSFICDHHRSQTCMHSTMHDYNYVEHPHVCMHGTHPPTCTYTHTMLPQLHIIVSM